VASLLNKIFIFPLRPRLNPLVEFMSSDSSINPYALTNIDMWECVECEPPYFTSVMDIWIDGIPNCRQCTTGEIPTQISYNDVDLTVCMPCDRNRYRQTLASPSTCVDCPDGSFSASGSSNCTTCLPGTEWLNNTETISCTQCEEGTYSLGGNSMCTECPVGMIPDTAKTAQCIDCPVNTYSKGTTTCTPCLVGEYSQAGSSGCNNISITCSAGSMFNTSTQLCDLCAHETYNLKPSQKITCETLSDGQVATECSVLNGQPHGCRNVQCDLGYVTYLIQDGIKCVATLDATDCGFSKYQSDLTKRNSCIECALGEGHVVQYSAKSTDCQPCLPGSFRSTGLPFCQLCPTGTYQELPGMSECKLCPVGKSSGLGATIITSCTLCPPGTFSDQLFQCRKCSPGYKCQNGFQTACESGTAQPQAGQSSCITCLDTWKIGKPSMTDGPIFSCTACNAAIGEYLPSNSITCSPCLAGNYLEKQGVSNGDSTHFRCITCPVGHRCENGVKYVCASGRYQVNLNPKPVCR
jgi:hypothetical protein